LNPSFCNNFVATSYYYSVGNIVITDYDKITPECMNEFKEKIDLLANAYIENKKHWDEKTDLKQELDTIKNTWYYKLFNKKQK
jgi:hypothetical protein